MNSLEYKRFMFSSLCFLIMSCVAIDDYRNFWHRGRRESTFFEKMYLPIDSISINRIVICKQKNEVKRQKFQTKGQLNIIVEDTEKDLINVLKKNFNHVDYEIRNDTTGSFNCNYLTQNNVLSGDYNKFLRKTQDHSIEITLNMLYKSGRAIRQNFDGGGSVSVLDYDSHHIISHLRLAIFKSNELVYMNNYIHSKTMSAGLDEDVSYKIKKSTIDSLVNMSLEKFYNRLK